MGGRKAPRRARSRERGAQPARHRKRFGQHFLAPAWARKVVDAIDAKPGDVFLEIGPGEGALTLPLAAGGFPILAVEIDRDLTRALASQVPPNVSLVTADFLETDVVPFLTGLGSQRPPGAEPAPPRRFRVVGNLPYNLSSPILFRLIALQRAHALFDDATLMLQREVADRLLARPGTRDYGVLGITAQVRTRIERLLDLPPGAFRPPPQVRSTVVRLAFGEPTVRLADEALFESLVKTIFQQRRKTLANALKAFDSTAPAVLALAELDGRRRPETLQLTELARLTALFAAVRRGPVL